METTKTARLMLVPEPLAAPPADTEARGAAAPRVRRYRLARLSADATGSPPRRP